MERGPTHRCGSRGCHLSTPPSNAKKKKRYKNPCNTGNQKSFFEILKCYIRKRANFAAKPRPGKYTECAGTRD